MIDHYKDGTYCLTENHTYSVSRSQLNLMGNLERVQEADMIWGSILLPRHTDTYSDWLIKIDCLQRRKINKLHIPVDDTHAFCVMTAKRSPSCTYFLNVGGQ